MVGGAKYDILRGEIQPTIYFPSTGGSVDFELRTASGPTTFIPAVRAAVNGVDSNLPLIGVQTQKESIDNRLIQGV